MKKALIIIDVQNDYFEGGAFPLYQAESARKNILLLLKKFIKENYPVSFIQHIGRSKKDTFFLPNTHGVCLHPSFDPFLLSHGVHVIEKAYPNSFLQTNLHERLQEQKIGHLVICGMMTHMCVDSTTRQACDLGYPVTLISDACATRDLSFGKSTVSAINVQNTFLAALSSFSKVETTADFLL